LQIDNTVEAVVRRVAIRQIQPVCDIFQYFRFGTDSVIEAGSVDQLDGSPIMLELEAIDGGSA
jgi:hypothetical protein